ncbi:MAG: SLC13 family permease [Rhodospirillales bacterium]
MLYTPVMELLIGTGAEFQMWAVFALILVALVFYVFERAAMEVTSLGIICALLIFFHFFPVGTEDAPSLTPGRILQGFANPALITVLALLVMGQGMVRTGVLDRGASLILGAAGRRGGLLVSLLLILLVAMAVSAFLNNIPVVVIFIPIMQMLASRYGRSVSKLMIPLSYAAVLGGMTTLIGSSTNLLVNSALIEVKVAPFGFFDFSIPGLVMATTGLLYVLLISPRLLPDRAGLADSMVDGDGKHFVAQITVSADSDLVGKDAPGGHFSGLPDKTLRMVQRGERAILPPFEDYTAKPGDVLVVAATRKALARFLAEDPGLLHPDLEAGRSFPGDVTSGGRWQEGGQSLAEVMVAPASGFIGLSLPQIGFRYKTHCIVLGLQRRSRMIRQRITDVRLQSGDVLLIQGQPDDLTRLRRHRDVVLLEGSSEELPALDHAKRATAIFLGVVALAASGVLPIVVAALAGAAAMVMVGVLNVRQAFQAVDAKIVTTIGAALALGVALQETGGAQYIAQALVSALEGETPATILSLFFLLVAVLSNIISTKTAAVLFTPIAVDLAQALGVQPQVFAVAVIFAANCSFASPLGYQTNLLVMGPGHYRFTDFFRAGLPLIVLLWLVFTLFAPWYYGI